MGIMPWCYPIFRARMSLRNQLAELSRRVSMSMDRTIVNCHLSLLQTIPNLWSNYLPPHASLGLTNIISMFRSLPLFAKLGIDTWTNFNKQIHEPVRIAPRFRSPHSFSQASLLFWPTPTLQSIRGRIQSWFLWGFHVLIELCAIRALPSLTFLSLLLIFLNVALWVCLSFST